MKFLTKGRCGYCGVQVEGANCLAVEEYRCERCGRATAICNSCRKKPCPRCGGKVLKVWPCENAPPLPAKYQMRRAGRGGRDQWRSACQR